MLTAYKITTPTGGTRPFNPARYVYGASTYQWSLPVGDQPGQWCVDRHGRGLWFTNAPERYWVPALKLWLAEVDEAAGWSWQHSDRSAIRAYRARLLREASPAEYERVEQLIRQQMRQEMRQQMEFAEKEHRRWEKRWAEQQQRRTQKRAFTSGAGPDGRIVVRTRTLKGGSR